MLTSKRLLALLLCLGMLLVLSASSAFLVHESGHDCCGDGCAVCESIAHTKALLQSFLLLGMLLAARYSFSLLFRSCRTDIPVHGCRVPTLVTWKIRLND